MDGGARLAQRISPAIARFVNTNDLATPCLVFELNRAGENYAGLRNAFPEARIAYAVKANPARPVLRRLVDLGSSFEASSWEEIAQCIEAGAAPGSIAFGNTVKRPDSITRAAAAGVHSFAFDCDGELEKIAALAPGARVYCRVMVDNAGADWPLSRKFGTTAEDAARLLRRAKALGLVPDGASFHVGSQQTTTRAYADAIATMAPLFHDRSLGLTTLNLGGGFPTRHRDDVPAIGAFADEIRGAVARHLGGLALQLVIEPGRFLVGDAAALISQVLLVSRRPSETDLRWIYLDVGRFSGLAETEGEAIKYRIATPHDGTPTGPVVIAGPTCDGADVLYERSGYALPLALAAGDRVALLATGAYVSTYASVGFNGFLPLSEYFV